MQDNREVIIGLAGRMRSGKDSVARRLVEKLGALGYQPVVFRFAEPLKALILGALLGNQTAGAACALILGGDEHIKASNEPVGSATLERVVREVNTFLKKNGLPALNVAEKVFIYKLENQPLGAVYRRLMQFVGTEIVRARSPEFWANALAERLARVIGSSNGLTHAFVIPDVRFKNEAEVIKRFGGVVVKLKRKPGSSNGLLKSLETGSNHASELSVDDLVADFEVEVDPNSFDEAANVILGHTIPSRRCFYKKHSCRQKPRYL